MAIRVATTAYTLTGDALTIRRGAATKTSTHIELYRVRDVATTQSLLTGGKVALTMHDGSSHTVGPIKDADTVGVAIRAAVSRARASQNVQHREDL